MLRNLASLTDREYDLVIVGGGIFGLCAAWDATLRGLSVALLERWDFAHAASANCFKMIHGGIRYLQHADLARVRHSARERSAFLRIAPHLARPLPIFVPTYGHGLKGREILTLGMKIYDLLTADRNRQIPDRSRHIPATRSLSRRQAMEMFPDLPSQGLSGGALFHDGQMYSTARLALAFLLSATERGAVAANYTEVTGLREANGRVTGVKARDAITKTDFDVRGRVVLNAAGGWAPHLRTASNGRALQTAPSFSRDAYFLVNRPMPGPCALAVSGQDRDPDAIFSREARHLFLVPWRGCTLVGVWHRVYTEDPAEARVRKEEVAGWLDEVRTAYPALDFGIEDVVLTHCGLVLFGENNQGASDLRYGKRSMLVDHARHDGREGLLTLIGVRYTTARADAARAVELAFEKLGHRPPRCQTESTPIYGGDIESFESELERATHSLQANIGSRSIAALVANHGSAWKRVVEIEPNRPDWLEPLPGSDTLAAEVVHAVRNEMALHLSDVVFRRSDLGTIGHPGMAGLRVAAGLMGDELGWNPDQRRAEIDATSAHFPALHWGESGAQA